MTPGGVMLWAEAGYGEAAGYLSAAGVVCTAIVSGTVALIKLRHRHSQERDASAVGQYREVADRLQREVERRDAHITALSAQNEQLWEDRSECEVEVAELFGYVGHVAEHNRRMTAALKKLGEDPGEVLPPPARRRRPDRAQREFEHRSLQQGTALLLPPEKMP